nr:hypothetical protein [Xenococcaceae cyanobacterium MO_167.B52]
PIDPNVYVELAETVWSDPRDNSWAQELLMQSFIKWLNNQKVLDKLIPSLKQWLGLVQLHGSSSQRQAYGENKVRQEINNRVGKELVAREEFSFCGYDLIPTLNDYRMRLTRVALNIISHFPSIKQFIPAISKLSLAEAIINYPSKYDVLQLIFLTASESLWDEVNLEAEKLIGYKNKVAYQAAYRLLSLEASKKAYELRQTLPDNLFTIEKLSVRHKEERHIVFHQWTQKQVQEYLPRDNIPLHLIAEKLQPHSINPDFEIPNNLEDKFTPLIEKININSIWSSYYKDTDDSNFERYEPALCAYAPNTIAGLVKSIMNTIASRSNIGIRQLSFHIWEHYLILDKSERDSIIQAWQKFETESNIQENLEQIAGARLFRVVLESLEAEEQLDYLLKRPISASDSLDFERSFKSLNDTQIALSKLEKLSEQTSLSRILWFLLKSHDKLETKDIEQYICPLLKHESSFIRSLAIKMLYFTENRAIIKNFINSPWKLKNEYHDLEIHWESLLLCKYGQELSFDKLKTRLNSAYLGIAIKFRGIESEEIDRYANYLDLKLQQIQNTIPELPPNFPTIEIKICDDNDLTDFDLFDLADKYFNFSKNFISKNSTWGGMDLDSLQRTSILTFEDRDNHRKEVSIILRNTVEEQNFQGNCFFVNKIPKNVLLEVIRQNPDLIEKWLGYIENDPSQKLAHICRVFYENLCAVLIVNCHEQAIDLYKILKKIESKIVLLDAKTRIRYLEYYLFQAPPSNTVKQQWLEKLENCRSDLEIMELIIAIQQGKRTSWLKSYIEEKLDSSAPFDFSRAVCLLGFLETQYAFDKLTELAKNEPHTWRKKLVDRYISHWQRNSWAKYWFQKFFNELNNIQAWRSFRLFLKAADGRFWSWKDENIKKCLQHDFYQLRLTFLDDNIETIKKSIKRNKKDQKLEEIFLGCKILPRQISLFM